MRAEILTIGDELCRGEIVDGNSASLAARLWDLDITTRWMTSCNDDETDLAAAVTQAARRADLVVCSGGLGPTEDDLTVDVVSRLAGAPPVIDEPALLAATVNTPTARRPVTRGRPQAVSMPAARSTGAPSTPRSRSSAPRNTTGRLR
jgi:nicotinamide-nucleotide amidase